MNEQEIQTDTDDIQGNGKHFPTPEVADRDDTAANAVGSKHIETDTAETDDVEGNAMSPRRAFPNTTKPGRSHGSNH